MKNRYTFEKVKADCEKDLKKHKCRIVRDEKLSNGFLRVLSFRDPDNGFDHFNVTCTPGVLTMTGDRGTFVFERHGADMLRFFNGKPVCGDYQAEKCTAAYRPIREYCIEDFLEAIADIKERMRECNALEEEKDQDWLGFESCDEMCKELNDIVRRTDEKSPDMLNEKLYEITGDFEALATPSYSYSFMWACCALSIANGLYDQELEEYQKTFRVAEKA